VGYTLINGDDPSVESFRGVFFKIRRALGTTAFGINEIRLPAGADGIEHDELETGHEEVYIVLEGDGRFTIDDEQVGVAAGDYLRVDAAAKRIVRAGGDGLRFVVVAARPQSEYDGRASL
jgi:mannose-6-phosphate isomerase-like protein (cupin superfamily)